MPTKTDSTKRGSKKAAPADAYARKEIRELKRCLSLAIDALKALGSTAPAGAKSKIAALEAEASDLMK